MSRSSAEEGLEGISPLAPWLEGLLEDFDPQIRSRGLVLRFEVESGLLVEYSPSLRAAIRELFRLILATVPDDCEIYFAGTKTTSPVSRIGAGQLSARWQVVGTREVEPYSSSPSRLHPRPGDARQHLGSPLATHVAEHFAKTKWAFSLAGIDGGGECVARASFE